MRHRCWLIALLLLIGIAAARADETARVTLTVDGFQKARSGAT